MEFDEFLAADIQKEEVTSSEKTVPHSTLSFILNC
jgi:hypothetical protein